MAVTAPHPASPLQAFYEHPGLTPGTVRTRAERGARILVERLERVGRGSAGSGGP